MEVAAGAIQLAFEATTGRSCAVVVKSARNTIESGMIRIVLDAGRQQGLRPAHIVKSLTRGDSNVPESALGSIDVQDEVAFIEIRDAAAKRLLKHTQKLRIRGVGAAGQLRAAHLIQR